jgi:hypothetical protein
MGPGPVALAGLAVQWTAPRTASESDQVDASERVVDLLHRTACAEGAEVDHGEVASWKSARTPAFASSPEMKITR